MNPAAFFFLTLFVAVAAHAQNGPEAETVVVEGPMVIGFFPPVTEQELNDPNSGAREGVAHTNWAVSDTTKCLKQSGITAVGKLLLTKTLIIKSSGSAQRIELPTTWPEAAGVYLLSPEKPPKAVYAQAGPSSLQVLAPMAAREYFQAQACE